MSHDEESVRDESLDADALTRIVAICEQFETIGRMGENPSPRIEEHLDRIEPALRGRLLRELLAIEVELRTAAGEIPALEDYLDRCPEWASAVAAVFSRDPRLSPTGRR